MSSALAIALLSSLAWAGFDASRKALVRGVAPLALVAWFGLAQAPGFLIWGFVEGKATQASYWPYGLTCLLFNVAANFLFFYAVKISPLSRTVPLLSLSPVFAAISGSVLLGEMPDLRQGAGIGIIVLGAFLLNARPEDLRRPWLLLTSLSRERGSLFMAGTALFWSLASTFDKLGLRHSGVGYHAALQTGGVAVVAALTLLARGRQKELLVRRRTLVGVGFGLGLAMAALGFQLVAVQVVFVSWMEAVKRAIGGAASVISGRVFFGEPVELPRLVSVALMAAGVFLLI